MVVGICYRVVLLYHDNILFEFRKTSVWAYRNHVSVLAVEVVVFVFRSTALVLHVLAAEQLQTGRLLRARLRQRRVLATGFRGGRNHHGRGRSADRRDRSRGVGRPVRGRDRVFAGRVARFDAAGRPTGRRGYVPGTGRPPGRREPRSRTRGIRLRGGRRRRRQGVRRSAALQSRQRGLRRRREQSAAVARQHAGLRERPGHRPRRPVQVLAVADLNRHACNERFLRSDRVLIIVTRYCCCARGTSNSSD